ncbi:hypothetical protein M441DRAFT_65614 [Trichoderma asperellum CBS 433.97]|uniref:SUR7 protein n=1 Tax=Trichoderma asperellum (strain ATCC 204424 / CBS 433.97 / NBRC 101777) TaxID=1042311 RepID=A0A2T3ZG80_TRIA4|nr:hypothetical protein M441DRAFT_65614 [Trichoderma asperellum CBS 433.97]PTB43814.1 hypothetical protein M441DRAFT_65614 [Trichoderma asperellum CBS 433.97]
MALIQRSLVLIPLALSFIAFVLINLALLSGHQQGFMEDYAVIRLNTSMLGQNILRDGRLSGRSNDGSDDNVFGKINAKDKLGDIADDILANIAEDLGISDWYSIHIMNACQGEFGANTTAYFSLNTTNCTHSSPSNKFNLTKILNQEMSIGPLGLSLADISWPDSIQDKISSFNSALLALFIFFILGATFTGLSMLACISAFFLGDKNIILLANAILALLAATMITLGSIIVTAASSIAVDGINKAGEKITLVADKGIKFYIISWVAVIFIILSTLFWITKATMLWKKDKRTYKHV